MPKPMLLLSPAIIRESVASSDARPITTPQQASIATGLHYKTTSRYLGQLTEAGLLENKPVKRYQFFMNRPLLELLNQA